MNGEKVISVNDYDYREDEYKIRIVTRERANLGLNHLGIRYYLYENYIESIVTKEQYKNIEYKVKE